MAKASGADPQWLSAPHSQIMVSQAGWPWGEHPWQVQTSQTGLGLTSQTGLVLTCFLVGGLETSDPSTGS